MEDFSLSQRDIQNARTALLEHYSSQITAHGTYLITLLVGFFSFVQALPFFQTLETLPRDFLRGFFLSIFLFLGVYLLGRTLLWGYLASAILRVTPKKESEIKIEEGGSATLLTRLHLACIDHVIQKHKDLWQFYMNRYRELELWVILFVVSILFWLLSDL